MISVLLPAFNESENPFFWDTIRLVQNLKSNGVSIELLVGAVNGHDNTLERLNSLGITPQTASGVTRGERFNLALAACSAGPSDWIVLNHPRSLLQEEALLELNHIHESVKWGAFTHQFDINHPLLFFTSWWSNNVRGDIKNIFYLDHCLFIRRSTLGEVGGVPELEIFEDTVLSQKLSQISRPLRLKWKSTTSAIRFQTKGPWKQALQNQVLKIRFMLGASDQKMNATYEKNINLNR